MKTSQDSQTASTQQSKSVETAHPNTEAAAREAALSPRCPRTNRPKFSTRTFPDLCRAFQLVTRIINREIKIAEHEEPDEEAKAKERLHIRELWTRVTSTANSIPGVDSVALARESLTKWDTRSGDPQSDERAA